MGRCPSVCQIKYRELKNAPYFPDNAVPSLKKHLSKHLSRWIFDFEYVGNAGFFDMVHAAPKDEADAGDG